MPNVFMPGFPDPNSINRSPDAIFRAGARRTLIGMLLVPTTTVVGEFIFLGRLRGSAMVLPSSQFIHGAAGGATTLDLGVLNQTPAGAVNCLAAAQSVVAAATKAGMASVTTPNFGRRLWELAGLTAAFRNVELDIGFRVQGGNPAAAFQLFAQIDYVLEL